MIPLWGVTGGLNSLNGALSFQVNFADLGSGVVDLSVSRSGGSGTATFTRATTAWTKLSTGLWASVASGSPRYCYFSGGGTFNTVAGTAGVGGYLTELAGTQLVTPTASIRDMTDASWVKVTMNTAKTAIGIDGVTNSATTITAAGASSTILQTLVAAASTRTYSCWIKRRTGTGTITLLQGATTLDVTALINSSTYTLVQLSASVLNSAFGIQITTSGDALDVDFNQFIAGSEATSPLDSAGAARNADVLTYPSAGNIDASQGTFYAEVSTDWTTAGANHDPFGFNPARLLGVNSAGAATTSLIFDGTTTVTKSGLTSMATAIRKRACSWGASGLSITGDGATPATGAFDGTLGASVSINIGNAAGGTQQLNGIIKTASIYSSQLSDATLQAMTL